MIKSSNMSLIRMSRLNSPLLRNSQSKRLFSTFDMRRSLKPFQFLTMRSVAVQSDIINSPRRYFGLSKYYGYAEGTHPKIPKRVQDLINKSITSNKLVVFMKGTPTFPQCGFSKLVIQILEYHGVPKSKIITHDVLEDQDLREGIKVFSQWPTIPQVYVNGEFVGGADIMRGMHDSGEIDELLTSHDLVEKSAEN